MQRVLMVISCLNNKLTSNKQTHRTGLVIGKPRVSARQFVDGDDVEIRG